MARKISFKETLDDAVRAIALWKMIPTFKIGDVDLNNLVGIHDEARALIDGYLKEKLELAGLKHRRDNKIRDLSNLLTRFRSGMRGQFGLDSIEYAQAGGTRSSARKPRRRKPKAPGKR